MYVDYNEPKTQNLLKLFRNLLKQLLYQLVCPPDDLLARLEDMRDDTHHSRQMINTMTAIVECARFFSTIFIVVDALDELESESRREDFLRVIAGLMKHNFQVFVNSRNHIQPHVGEQLGMIEISAHDEDIEAYVRRRLENTSVTTAFKAEIITNMLRSAKGTFVTFIV